MANLPAKQNITGVILAGGRGTRMGGADKGWVSFRGRALIEHVVTGLEPQVGTLIINANRNIERYATLGFPVVPDLLGGYLGPVAGIASGLRRVKTDYAVIVPCDAPLVAVDLVDRLDAAFQRDAAAEIAVAHDGIRIQPTFLLLRCDLADDLIEYLESGGRKLQHWLTRHRVAHADFGDTPDAFVNVNGPDECTVLERALAHRPDSW